MKEEGRKEVMKEEKEMIGRLNEGGRKKSRRKKNRKEMKKEER